MGGRANTGPEPAAQQTAVSTRERPPVPTPQPQGAGWQAQPGPPTYYWQALACLLLFLPTAIVALIYSFQVSRLARVGDWRGAVRSSRLARTWCLLSVLGFVVVFVLVANGVLSIGSPNGAGG